MNCEQVEELLSAYLDNMLAPEERRQVANHQVCRHGEDLSTEWRGWPYATHRKSGPRSRPPILAPTGASDASLRRMREHPTTDNRFS